MGGTSMETSGKIKGLKRALVEIAIFSAATNLLLFVSPLYMLQVYDRVLPSSSLETLVYLSIIGASALAVLGALEIVRAIYANRMAAKLDVQLGGEAFFASANGARAGLGDVQPLRDLAAVRSFIASRSIFFLFDLPFAPLFIIAIYFLHPLLCLITLVGVVLMFAIAWANQKATSKSGQKSSDALAGSMNMAQTFVRNYETIRALGMLSNVTEAWGKRYAESLVQSDSVASTNAVYGGVSRFTRTLLQSAILGTGGYLVLQGSMSAGMIFASSLISGRALQPFDQIIGSWRQIIDTHRAWKRLTTLSAVGLAKDQKTMSLPAAKGAITFEQVVYAPPETDLNRPVIKRISLVVAAGESVAIIGPSRAGKSTLARLIVGAIAPNSGLVRLDGADIRTWNQDELGRQVGYLAQDVELFPGTIAENIARFDADAADERIVAAAMNANAHQLILSQKKGYLTEIGPSGVRLSGGERQRIGLARAFYGDPKLMVLDEPNSNLDLEGEQALEQAIAKASSRGTTILLITHKPSIASKCDRILMLRDGQVELYGPATEVMQKLAQGGPKPASAPAAATTGEPANRAPTPAVGIATAAVR
jgi:ATP-binding cassette subfamily C protein